MNRYPFARAGLLLGAVALLVIGCSDDGSDDSGGSTTAAAATQATTEATDPAGPTESSDSTAPAATDAAVATTPATEGAATPAAPTGDPIVIAMISQESGPAALPDSRLAAEAAVAYVNSELGGAAGRPLQLETCVTDGSPEQSSACANQLLEKSPVAFVGETELGTAGSVPIIEAAGVPLVGAAGITPELVLSQNAFAFGLDAVADWAGWARYLTSDGGAKTINLINLDIPVAPIFEQVIRSVAEANGATLGEVVTLPLTATDATAQMAAAAGGDPDVIMAVTSAQLCVPLAQAHETLAPDTKLFLPGICGSPQTLEAAGGSIEGTLIGFGSLNPYDTDEPEVAEYRAALDAYGDDVPLSQFAGNAFTSVMNLKAVLDELGADGIDPAAISAAFRASVGASSFMTDTSTCDGTVVSSPVTCVRGRRVFEVSGSQLIDISNGWYDGTSQVSLG
jgi:branched-chain amino acid transport system substrate-binding protein